MEVLDLFFENERVTSAHHDTAIILVSAFRQRSLVVSGLARIVRVFSVLVLIVVVLILVTETAHPLGAFLFILLLEDLDLDSG